MSTQAPPTPTEQEILDLVLRELRRANREGNQIGIMIDPFTARGCDGAHVAIDRHPMGTTYEFNGKIRGKRRALRRDVG